MMIKFLKKLFHIHSSNKEWTKVPVEYHEKDTRCDLCECEFKKDCHLIEITTLGDTRKHFINGIGFICPLRRKENENG